MSYCKFCGSRLEDEALFCPGCGASREAATDGAECSPEPEAHPVPIAAAPVRAADDPPRGMNGFAIAGFAAAFSVPLAGLILSIIALGRAKSGEYKNPMRSLSTWGIVVSIMLMVLALTFSILWGVFMKHLLQYIFENIDIGVGLTY